MRKFIVFILTIFLLACGSNSPRSLKSIADSLYHADNYQEAIKCFDTLIKLEPKNGEYYYKRGFSYDMVYKQQALPQAVHDYLKAIELGYKRAKAYDNIGLSFMFVNDSIALYYFQKSLELEPDNPAAKKFIAHIRKGSSLGGKGK